MQKAIGGNSDCPLDLINAHATGTQMGDQAELLAIHRLSHFLNDRPLLVTANKGHLGHCFSAAGAIETILTIMSLQKGEIPMIANLDNSLSTNY
jgi:3-oxoacyl-(acyl-carrier-protein) synthase